ncbi:hypothetical protein BG011_006813 [Mortierella polycephala]|uniref:Citrate transporter-like domain-containing protein n=1 Tax=Mortierella polycephala TaxID=41804 RepID=A0A9P6QDT7_9FUNG|nr:hypothetical protein BG011_006813 [Mortierella polycephala]
MLVIRPDPKVPARTPKSRFPYGVTLDIATAPVLGVLFLLATLSIGGESVRDSIVWALGSGVEPYAATILFFFLAYLCISLDMTGVFQYAAFWVSKRGGGGGQRIFLSFFLLSSAMSELTSNDVVILTMTPFLAYYSHAVDLAIPVAFFMAEIQTTNIASMALYIDNLTNVVACQAYEVLFLEYSAWMLLPCFAPIAACYFILRINFRHKKYIPKALESPDVDPRSCLVDPVGAIFGLAVLASSLICLGKSKGPGATSLIEKSDKSTVDAGASGESRMEQGALPEIAVPDPSIVHAVQIMGDSDDQQNLKTVDPTQMKAKSDKASIKDLEGKEFNEKQDTRLLSRTDSTTVVHSTNKRASKFERKFPLLHAIAIRMPWAILPFTFSMFTMAVCLG